MSPAPLADELRDLVNANASDDQIAEVLARRKYLPPIKTLQVTICVDALVLRERERLPVDAMVAIISPKRLGGQSASNVRRIVSGKFTPVNNVARKQYEAMTEDEVAARHAFLME